MLLISSLLLPSLLSPFLCPMLNFRAKCLSSLAWIVFIFLKLDERITNLDFSDTTKYTSKKIITIWPHNPFSFWFTFYFMKQEKKTFNGFLHHLK